MDNEETETAYQDAKKAESENQFERCATIMQQLALKGYVKAMYTLALLYHEGRGMPESPRHAEYWLRMGAEQGDRLSIYSLATFLMITEPCRDPLVRSRKILMNACARKHISQTEMSVFMEELMGMFRQETEDFFPSIQGEPSV